MTEYDRIAAWYAATRSPGVGVAEVARAVQGLARGARVLDLGCGTGAPLTEHLVGAGLAVTALDSSPAMIARTRARLPSVDARCARIQDAAFADGAFGAVVAWGVLFHLAEADQAAAIGRVARWLEPGGRFVFTSGAERGVRTGTMGGVAFEYVSLGRAGYRAQVERAGMRLLRSARDAWDNHVYLAEAPD